MWQRTVWTWMALLPLTGAAAGRVGELEVRTGTNAAPCFTVSEREEGRAGTPLFQSIVVSDAAGAAPMWSMSMPKGRTFALASYMCVPYGGRPAVLPQTAALPLKPGRIYEVAVQAAPGKPGGPRHYRGRFCMTGRGTGANVTWLGAGRASCPR